jgi:diacylglycerol O-acyltransferase 1
VWLKLLSYAFTNRDLRDSYLESYEVPEIYAACPYPENITLANLVYFWWAPTLVYQPVYPRSGNFRLLFFVKRFGARWFLTSVFYLLDRVSPWDIICDTELMIL